MIITAQDRNGKKEYYTGTDLIIQTASVLLAFLIVFGGLFLILNYISH